MRVLLSEVNRRAGACVYRLNKGRYFPYPSASSFETGMNRIDAEFMQYRIPVGPGPSGNRWPRWESALAERTSVRSIPCVWSVLVFTFSGSSGALKLGHPVPESNLSSELKSGSPETTST